MENKEIQLKVLGHLQTELMETLEYEFGDGYLCATENDIVCHFSMPSRKGWKFGIWLNGKEDGKYKASVFGQYVDYIDKFKPGSSPFSYDVEIDEDFENLYEELYDFVEDLTNIKTSNWASLIMYYWHGYGGPRHKPLWWLVSNFYHYKIHEKTSWFWHNKVLYWHLKTRVFVEKLLIGRNFKSIEIDDNNEDCFVCVPRYNVNYTFNDANKANTYRLYRFANRYTYKNASVETFDENGDGFCFR